MFHKQRSPLVDNPHSRINPVIENPQVRLARGSLWSATVHNARTALERGAIHPIETKQTFTDDAGVRFSIRCVSTLADKIQAQQQAAAVTKAGAPVDPFLPYDPDLFVARVSTTHVALLNKFPVYEHHLLIVTREFEHQEMLLTDEDFVALAACMAEFEALAFYNSGTQSGASQPHKHLQMVPLPLSQTTAAVPIEPLLEAAPADNRIHILSTLPFRHAFARLDPALFVWPESGAPALRRVYLNMLRTLDLEDVYPGDGLWQAVPYNLLLTREWMLLVPRSQEKFEAISVNALGFAGSFFVYTPALAEVIVRAGPMTVLHSVALPRDP